MKPGHCQACSKYTTCISYDRCYFVTVDLNRLENGRKKHIILVYEHELNDGPLQAYLNITHGVQHAYGE